VEAVENEGPRYPMGARVNFKGLDRDHQPWSGFFICAFATIEAAKDIAMAIASQMGVADSVTGTVDSVDQVLGEFLNIVIGLTCSDWIERGFETEFDPPEMLLERKDPGFEPEERAYHLTMTIEGHPEVSFFLVFLASPQEAQ
ncbi:MAG: chemotaxis protein CheX, partial [Deltaproteobacteria bacterium]|nr:chemotaxis protein CheX [Deltaproteobacteria bacterium]